MNIAKKLSLYCLTIGLCLLTSDIQAKKKAPGIINFLFPLPAALYNAGCDETSNKTYRRIGDGSFYEIFYPGDINTTFDDVAGLDDAKADMQNIIDYLNNSQEFEMMGVNPPKGILMNGAPGNGKTLLARAVAGEINRPFINVSGSSINGQYVGEGSANIRELFHAARSIAPCIIFIDEIDAVASKRSDQDGSVARDRNETLTALLTEMDGLHQHDKPVIVFGATNRIEQLDPAIIRPGRFDRVIEIKKPKLSDREKLLQLNFKKVTHAYDLDITKIAEMTSGYSGADLTNLVNQAALLAMQDESFCVNMNHIKKAFNAIKNSMITVIDTSSAIEIIYPGDINITFDDVAGLDDAKENLQDIIGPFKPQTRHSID